MLWQLLRKFCCVAFPVNPQVMEESPDTGSTSCRFQAVEPFGHSRNQSAILGKPGESDKIEKMCLKQMPSLVGNI